MSVAKPRSSSAPCCLVQGDDRVRREVERRSPRAPAAIGHIGPAGGREGSSSAMGVPGHGPALIADAGRRDYSPCDDGARYGPDDRAPVRLAGSLSFRVRGRPGGLPDDGPRRLSALDLPRPAGSPPCDELAMRVPVAALTALRDSHGTPRSATGWIFHVAHCGSTLLARALDRPDGQSGPARAAGAAPARPRRDPRTTPGARACIWRRRLPAGAIAPEAPTIVKANVPVNFIAGGSAGARSGRASHLALFPAADLSARDPAQPGPSQLGGQRHHRSSTGDLARATWRAGRRGARRGALAGADARFMRARLRAIRAREAWMPTTLFDAPRGGARRRGRAFRDGDGGPSSIDRRGRAVRDLFRRARLRPFDNAARLGLRAETAALLGPEIARARRWVESRHAAIPARLDRPLAGPSPTLLDD